MFRSPPLPLETAENCDDLANARSQLDFTKWFGFPDAIVKDKSSRIFPSAPSRHMTLDSDKSASIHLTRAVIHGQDFTQNCALRNSQPHV